MTPQTLTTTAGASDDATARRATAGRHHAWLAGGMALSFLVPFLLADQFDVQRDVHYGIYMAAVAGLFVA
jgi:hypothetical protein